MSRASSPSSGRRYGTARVCQLWETPRSTVYARRARASRSAQPAAKRGPKGAGTDAALTEQIRAVLARSPFIGEGYRKAWARLRLTGVRTSKGRVLRLMRAAGLLAPTRVGRRRGPRNHDGTIPTDRPDELWGTDATACLTTREGQRHGLHRRRPLHAGVRRHPRGSPRHALRGARVAPPGAAGRASPPGSACVTTTAASTSATTSRASCASSASARARRSWPHPRATAAPSASSARSRSSCSGWSRSRRSSSCASRCSRSRTATTRSGWSSATATAPRPPSARRSRPAPERLHDYRERSVQETRSGTLRVCLRSWKRQRGSSASSSALCRSRSCTGRASSVAGARQRGASLPGGRDRLFSGCSLSGGIQLANVSLAEFDVDKIREQYVGRGGAALRRRDRALDPERPRRRGGPGFGHGPPTRARVAPARGEADPGKPERPPAAPRVWPLDAAEGRGRRRPP